MSDVAARAPRPSRRLATAAVTLMVIAGAAAAVLTGVSAIGARGASAVPPPAPQTVVGAMTVEMLPGYAVTRRFTGQVEAAARIDLGFELGGRITELAVREGDEVPAGAVLARLDTAALHPERAALEADLAALSAEADLARLALVRSDALTERGFRSVAALDDARLALTRAEAGMAALRARIAGVDVRLEKSDLTAPFAARIGARLADPGQTVAAGQAVLVLHDAAPLRARVGLPPDLAASLAPGDAVRVEAAGVSLPARVVQIRPDLDPATRIRPIILSLPPEAGPALGETITVSLTQSVDEPGFWAPLAALREGARGSWSVMAIEATAKGDRILPAAVEVIHAEGERVFLRGALPPGGRIVSAAPDRVAPGQLVLARAD